MVKKAGDSPRTEQLKKGAQPLAPKEHAKSEAGTEKAATEPKGHRPEARFDDKQAKAPVQIIEVGNGPSLAGKVPSGSWLESVGIPAGSQVLTVDGAPVDANHPLGAHLEGKTSATLVVGLGSGAQSIVLKRPDPTSTTWAREGEPTNLGAYWPTLGPLPVVVGYQALRADGEGFQEPSEVRSNEDLKTLEWTAAGSEVVVTFLDNSTATLLREDDPAQAGNLTWTIAARGRLSEPPTLEQLAERTELRSQPNRESATWFGARGSWHDRGLVFEATTPWVPKGIEGIEPGDLLETVNGKSVLPAPIEAGARSRLVQALLEVEPKSPEKPVGPGASAGARRPLVTLGLRRSDGSSHEVKIPDTPFHRAALDELQRRVAAPAVHPGDFLQSAGLSAGWLITGMRRGENDAFLSPATLDEVKTFATEGGATALELEALAPDGVKRIALTPPPSKREPWTAESRDAGALVTAQSSGKLSYLAGLLGAGIPEGTVIDRVLTLPSDFERQRQEAEAEAAKAANQGGAEAAEQAQPMIAGLEQLEKQLKGILSDGAASAGTLAAQMEEALVEASTELGRGAETDTTAASPLPELPQLLDKAHALTALANGVDELERRAKANVWEEGERAQVLEAFLSLADEAISSGAKEEEIAKSLPLVLEHLPDKELPFPDVDATARLEARARAFREARNALTPLLKGATSGRPVEPKEERKLRASLAVTVERQRRRTAKDTQGEVEPHRSALVHIGEGVEQTLRLARTVADLARVGEVSGDNARFLLNGLRTQMAGLNQALLQARSQTEADTAYETFSEQLEGWEESLNLAEADSGLRHRHPGIKWDVKEVGTAEALNTELARMNAGDTFALASTRLGMSWNVERREDGRWRLYGFGYQGGNMKASGEPKLK